MKAGVWLALAALLLCTAAAQAGPFTSVPLGNWAYGECAHLARLALLPGGADFTGQHELSRYEFGVALAAPAEGAARVDQANDPVAAALRGRLTALPPAERKWALESLARLLAEFRDTLTFVGIDPDRARLQAQRLIAAPPAWLRGAPNVPDAGGLHAGTEGNGAVISYDVGASRLALRYSESTPERSSLGSMGLSLPSGGASPTKGALDGPNAITEPRVRSLAGSLEYGLTNNLSLDVAYERMVKEGHNLANFDTTDLRSLGLRYRLSPSTSLRLRYHIIEYAEPADTTPRYQDRLTEGRLSVSF